MWIGTNNGLNRFDGYVFDVFKHDMRDTGGLPNNNVSGPHLDTAGYMWLGGQYQFSQLEPQTGKIRRINLYDDQTGLPLNGYRYQSLMIDDKGTVWTSTGKTLIEVTYYDPLHPDSVACKQHSHLPGDSSLSFEAFFPSFNDSKERMWLGGNRGAMVWDRKLGKGLHIPLGDVGLQGGVRGGVRRFAEDRQGKIWMASYGGLCSITIDEELDRYHTQMEWDLFPVDGSPFENAYEYVYTDKNGWTVVDKECLNPLANSQ